jgi:glycosyltransferase involved in cell wall biosynthesis
MKSKITFFFLLSIAHLFSKVDLTVVGNINMADGIGKQSVELIQALKNDLSINFIDTLPPEYKDVPREILPILQSRDKTLGNIILLEDQVWTPQRNTYQNIVNRKKKEQILIAYSVFESDKIPWHWVKAFNDHFDAIAVADRYYIDVYRNSGVKIPIFELPLGLEIDPLLSAPIKTRQNSPFTFGCLGYGTRRKNLPKLIKAFAMAFGNRPDVQLRINCRNAEIVIEKKIDDLIEEHELTNVIFTKESLSREQYINLLKTLDCYVTVSMGEGFSIPPREAMALGIPVIATDATAQKTLCDSDLVRRVMANIPVKATYCWTNTFTGSFFDCTVEEIAAALIDMHENYPYYLKKNEEARSWAADYSYKRLRPYYLSLLKPTSVILGRENRLEPGRLITNSKELYNKYNTLLKKK